MAYEKYQLSGRFFKQRGFYLFFRPILVPYMKLAARARAAGFRADDSSPILESAPAFGRGWIAVPVMDGPRTHPDVISLGGEYLSFTYVGAYSGLGKVYQQIMREHPGAKEFYNLYLDSPKVPAEKRRTMVLFR